MSEQATYKKVVMSGETYILKYNMNAISTLEEYYQKGIFKVIDEEFIGFNTIRNLLWAGMLWKNPNLKVHQVGEMIENEMEESDEFDIKAWMKIATEGLYQSKAFKLMQKAIQRQVEAEEKEEDSKN